MLPIPATSWPRVGIQPDPGVTSLLTPSSSKNWEGIILALQNDNPIHQLTIPLPAAKPQLNIIITPFWSPRDSYSGLEQTPEPQIYKLMCYPLPLNPQKYNEYRPSSWSQITASPCSSEYVPITSLGTRNLDQLLSLPSLQLLKLLRQPS